MKKAQYQALHDFVAARPALRQTVVHTSKILPLIVYVAYPVLLLWMVFFDRAGLLRAILVPAVGFVAATVVRSGQNLPRPYEALGIPAIAPKDTHGKSFPSRHAACVAVIALTTLHEAWIPGVLLIIIGILIAVSRVLAGVHFIRDVVCGLLIGGLVGLIGMYVI